MAERYPITAQQRGLLKRDLAELKNKMTDFITLVRTCYGEMTEPASRAEETAASLQRLEWALQRESE